MTKSKVDLVIDLQYGSTGKGLIAGYLAMENGYDVVVNANMPNAGHTFIDEHGNKMMHKVLPNGIVSPNLKYVLIGPGSVFGMNRLIDEIKQARELGYMKNASVWVHPNAVLLTEEHRKSEKAMDSIGSTKQGSSAAMIEKIKRNPDNNPTIGYRLPIGLPEWGIFVPDAQIYNNMLKIADSVLAEGAQGFSLGINERFYPFCTSRDCTPARFLADMGIPVGMLNHIIGTARTLPIRVGGTSGGHYSDQEETSWEALGLDEERTTVTNKIRRVFTFSEQQIKDAMWACEPDIVFLNFVNYIKSWGTIEHMDRVFNHRIEYFGFGPTIHDVRKRNEVFKDVRDGNLYGEDQTDDEFPQGEHRGTKPRNPYC